MSKSRVHRAYDALVEELGRAPSVDEVSEVTGYEPDLIRQLLQEPDRRRKEQIDRHAV